MSRVAKQSSRDDIASNTAQHIGQTLSKLLAYCALIVSKTQLDILRAHKARLEFGR